MIIASAAAVPSSSSDALAIGMPVRSLTIVWKMRRELTARELNAFGIITGKQQFPILIWQKKYAL